MIAPLVAAAIVAVMLVIMVREACLSAQRTRGIFSALIFLIPKLIFAIAIERMIVVAFRALNMV